MSNGNKFFVFLYTFYVYIFPKNVLKLNFSIYFENIYKALEIAPWKFFLTNEMSNGNKFFVLFYTFYVYIFPKNILKPNFSNIFWIYI